MRVAIWGRQQACSTCDTIPVIKISRSRLRATDVISYAHAARSMFQQCHIHVRANSGDQYHSLRNVKARVDLRAGYMSNYRMLPNQETFPMGGSGFEGSGREIVGDF